MPGIWVGAKPPKPKRPDPVCEKGVVDSPQFHKAWAEYLVTRPSAPPPETEEYQVWFTDQTAMHQSMYNKVQKQVHFAKLSRADRLGARLRQIDERATKSPPSSRTLSTRAQIASDLKEATRSEAQRRLEEWRKHSATSGLQAHQVYGRAMRGHSSSLRLPEGVSPGYTQPFSVRTTEYYRQLYSKGPTTDEAQNALLGHVKELTAIQVAVLDAPLTLEELTSTVDSMADNSQAQTAEPCRSGKPRGRTRDRWSWDSPSPLRARGRHLERCSRV